MCQLRMKAALVASPPLTDRPALPVSPRLCQQAEKPEFSCPAQRSWLKLTLTGEVFRAYHCLQQATTSADSGKV